MHRRRDLFWKYLVKFTKQEKIEEVFGGEGG